MFFTSSKITGTQGRECFVSTEHAESRTAFNMSKKGKEKGNFELRKKQGHSTVATPARSMEIKTKTTVQGERLSLYIVKVVCGHYSTKTQWCTVLITPRSPWLS